MWNSNRKPIMNMIKKTAIFVALSICICTSHAITNTAIAVSGTNIILSWPSFGYESYLVQYRQTLDASDSWSCFTNAYRANSTNLTTLTVYGVVPAPGGTDGSSAAMNANGNNLSSMIMVTGPLAVPVGGSGGGLPVAIYPPGFDFSGFNIFDPLTGETVGGADFSNSPPALQTQLSPNMILPSGET
jgi:hypothetical protein